MLLCKPWVPMLAHPLSIAEKRLLRAGANRLRRCAGGERGGRSQEAARSRSEGQRPDLQGQLLRVVPLVKAPIRNDIGVRSSECSISEVQGRGELRHRSLRSNALNVETVSIHLHHLSCLTVLVVVDKHQLRGALIALLMEVLDEVLHLDLRRQAGLDSSNASHLGNHSCPMCSSQLSATEDHTTPVASTELAGPIANFGPMHLVSLMIVVRHVIGGISVRRHSHVLCLMLVAVRRMGLLRETVLIQELVLPDLPIRCDLHESPIQSRRTVLGLL
mmetsp:Transcript_44372/g.142139  ORF Transcript_44372/g.142139 Transcript_44372/m.142139 type:complete len:275 (+) Transcript_44372:309-1133(+)